MLLIRAVLPHAHGQERPDAPPFFLLCVCAPAGNGYRELSNGSLSQCKCRRGQTRNVDTTVGSTRAVGVQCSFLFTATRRTTTMCMTRWSQVCVRCMEEAPTVEVWVACTVEPRGGNYGRQATTDGGRKGAGRTRERQGDGVPRSSPCTWANVTYVTPKTRPP